MKNSQIILISALSLITSGCNEPIEKTSEEKGRYYGNAVKSEIHEDYLSCYALDKASKAKCTAKLADKYLRTSSGNKLDDKEYVQEFQYECEKQGFKKFLTEQEVKCNSINEGPEFIEDEQAYQVKCQPDKEYLMQFDYNNKQWSLKK